MENRRVLNESKIYNYTRYNIIANLLTEVRNMNFNFTKHLKSNLSK